MRSTMLIAMAIAIATSSCNKSNKIEYNSLTKAPLSVEFDNIVGGANLQLNSATYLNASYESFKITKLKHYVSNFVFTHIDGTIYTIPQDSSYFLIDESVPASEEPEFMLPEGEYRTVSFLVGVDSFRNTRDISKRTGVLDPTGVAADMYWGWNSGYIFLKLEGTSPSVTASGNAFQYHVGGFGGYTSPTPNNLKLVTLDLTSRGRPKIKSGKETNVHLFVDVLKILNGPTNMSFATLPMTHSPLPAVPIANNYASMFRHDHTEN